MIDTVARPWAFLLLLIVPIVLYRAMRSYADRPRGTKLCIAALRSFICALLIVELAGVSFWWKGKAGEEYLCYLADVSESIPAAARQQAQEQILDALEKKGGSARSSLALFGEFSALAVPFGSEMTPAAVRAAFAPYLGEKGAGVQLPGRKTDLARAVRQALASFPANAQKKIILLTDGNQTEGEVLQEAKAASEQNVQICPIPLVAAGSRDVVLASVSVPERIKRDEAFEIRCELRSASPAEGRLKLYVDDYLAEEKKVTLPRGAAAAVFRRSLDEGGGHLLRVQFEADFAQPAENDAAYTFLAMPGRPRAILVSQGDASSLQDALLTARTLVDQRSPVGAPKTMLELIRYDAVVIANVSAEQFGETRLRLLRDYVSEFGGGLVLAGGPDSFGPGGYAGTALEEASPLLMEVSKEERPSTAIIVGVDDSRSMWLHGTPDLGYAQETFGNPPKTFVGLVTPDKANFVKEVFKRVVLSLSPRDRVGAVGMSSDLLPARWYLRPQRVTDKQRLIQEFNRSFERHSFSVLYPTLDEARFNLSNDPATYRQILLLSDGYVQSDENYKKFAMMLLSDGVALSTVGVGGDSNERLLEDMARWGGGRYYSARDLKQLGEVYEKELQAPTAQLVIERPVSVALVEDSPLVAGLDMNLAPTLFGYVRTRPKARAQVTLVSEGAGDPLLASWPFGCGRVVAYTSSATGSWATLWVKDWEDGYNRFWRQILHGVFKQPGREIYRIHLQPEGLRLSVRADVLDANDNFINGASVSAQLYYLGERGDVFSAAVSWLSPLAQTAPGRYEHEFEVDRKGVYLVRVKGDGPNAGAVQTSGCIIAAPRELLEPVPDEKLLASLAQLTKGKVSATAAEAAALQGLEERRRYDLGFYAAALAALLLVLEVLARRWPAFLEFRRSLEARKAAAPAPPQPPTQSVRLQALLPFLFVLFTLGAETPQEAPTPPPPPQPPPPVTRPDKPPETALSPEAQKTVDKYMNLVLEDPRNEFAFDQVYATYESEKKTWKLLEFFIHAARLQHENANLQVILGLTYFKFRDYFKAAEHFRTALQRLPNDFFARLMLGRVYLKQGDPPKAREHLAEAVKVATGIDDRVDALLLLGEALALEDNRQEAQKAWSEVLEIQRYDVPTLQRLAAIYQSHGYLDKADEMIRGILDLSAKNPRITCESLIQSAAVHMARGDRKAAIEALRKAQATLFPDAALRQEVEVRILQLYRDDGRLDDFFQELERRVLERPLDSSLRKEIARLYLEENRPGQALEHVEKALLNDPRDVLLLEQAVELNLRHERRDQAARLLDQLYDITGHVPAYLIRKGEILWQEGKKEEALGAWRQTLSGETPSIERYQAITRVFEKHGLQDLAVESYQKMLEAYPAAQDARLSFGDYLLALDRKEDGDRILGDLTRPQDAPPALFLQVAEIYGNHDRDEPLLELLALASQRHPGDYRIFKRLGLAQERLQKYSEAMESFLRAYDQAPNWRERETIVDKLISLHLAYGKPPEGEGQGGLQGLGNLILKLHKDIQASPEDPEAFMALARIASVTRPTAETAFRSQPIYVKGLKAFAFDPLTEDFFPMGPMNAISYYTHALDRAPMRLDAYEGLARSFMLFDEFEKAVTEYKKLAIINPVGKWKYYFAIGDFFASQGQMPEAQAFWGRVAERAFTDATLYFRLGTRYHWADRPDQAISMLHKAISLHPDEYRYHLALGNILAERKDFAQAVSEYRKALRLSTQTMLLPVQRTMAETQIHLAHDLFKKAQYSEALEVYEEVRRFQEILNKDLGQVVAEYPDILVQILRTRARIASVKPGSAALLKLAEQFPASTCWVTDSLEMAIPHYAELEARGNFQPHMNPAMAKPGRRLPGLTAGFSVRLYPWILHPALSPRRLLLGGKRQEIELDTATGKPLAERKREGHVRYFDTVALRSFDKKLILSEIESGKILWETAHNWNPGFQVSPALALGLEQSKLQALNFQTGALLWEAPGCAEFALTPQYVTLKRLKQGKAASGGGLSIEEAAFGDDRAIGYFFQVLEAATGKVLFEQESTGTHYWRSPVAAGDLVLLTDEFDFTVHAYDIVSGKFRWRARFESFFAAPPILLDGKIFLYMRLPKLKTILQYALHPETGDILHQTDLQVNSLYARPIPIGQTLFFYDPVAYELIGVDRENGGVMGRHPMGEILTEGSKRNVVTLEGLDNHIFFYTWDGLVVRLDVATSE